MKEQEMSRVAEGNQMHVARIKKNELVAVLYVLGQKKDVVLGHSWMQIHFYLLIIHIPNELKLLFISMYVFVMYHKIEQIQTLFNMSYLKWKYPMNI